MATLAERLAEARAALETAGLSPADAALDAEVLARHLLGWDRAALLVRARDAEPHAFAQRFAGLVARRAEREPVAQIVGHREFWGLDFEVTRDVLIPRPETELVVDEALAFARRSTVRRVIDVGTGSGCIAIAVACELPAARVIAIDASAEALTVARRNAERHGVADRVELLQGDLLCEIEGSGDLILSNPPYVAEADAPALQPEVVNYEPRRAVFAGPDGLAVIRRLLQESAPALAPHGRLIVEFGLGQHDAVQALARDAGWTVVRVRQDLQAIPRTIVLSRSPDA